MARKRASKSADNSQEVCRPKKNKIQDEKAGKAKNKGNKGKIACASDRKVKGKLPPKHNEIKTNTRTMTAKENGTIPFKKKKNKDEKSKNKQSLSKQFHENDSNKRKASTSNLAPRTKKIKEDIVNSTCNTNTTPEKKIVNCKSSPKKGLKNEKPIQALQEDLHVDLLKDTKQNDDKDVVNPDSGEESEDEIEWEDVQEAEGQHGNSQALCPSSATPKSEDKNVEISIEIPGMKGKKRKRVQEDLMTKIQKAMNKFQKEIQLEKHKVHLLLLISVGFHRNAVCNQPCFQAFCLSYLPLQFINKSINKWQSSDVADFLTWFKDDFPSLQKLNFGLLKNDVISTSSLPRCLAEVLVALLRSLGFLARLVCSLQPVPMKIVQSKQSKKTCTKKNQPSKPKGKTPNNHSQTSPYFPADTTSKTPKISRTSRNKKTPSTSLNEKQAKQPKSRHNARKLRKKKKVNYTVNGTSGGSDDEDSDYEEESQQASSDEDEDFEKQKKFNLKTPKSSGKHKKVSPQSSSSPSVVDLLDDDDEFEVTSKPVNKKRPKTGTSDKPVQILSDDSESGEDVSFTSGSTPDFWVEVYLPSRKSWSSIDMESYSIDKPELCEDNAMQPLTYVLGFDNENKIKDVTGRYAKDWLSKTQKVRIDADWWEETLLPFKTKKKKMDENEDSLLLAKHQEKPLPQSITEYKNHPLYVLKRHLLKFEAIYPETAATLGFIRGEAVYSRDCLQLLHTREKWMSLEARVVKQGEQPYKIVKGRVKRNQPVVDPNSVTIDLFGRWQTEDYKPPPAKDGKVPKNEYGNVELFKPSMLPPGTKHIQIPGIQKIARKLGIDGAPAVVGFDFHCGFCHPIIDGLVVCKEHVSTLMDAWRQEQKEAQRRKEEKREKRVLGNWKLLVKSMLIRERLKRKYTSDNKESTTSSEQGEILEDEKVTEAVAWPQNMKEGKTSVDDDGHCHVFPKKLHKKDKITGEWTKACSCGFTLPLN